MKKSIGTMKVSRTPRRLFGLAAAAFCLALAVGSLSVQAGRGKQDLIILIPGETVYIEVIQNTVRSQPGFNWSDSGRNDRFYKVSRALEDAFAKRKVPLKVEVVVFGTRVPDGATKVRLALVRWDRNGMGEIEARFSAELVKGGSKINLGVFVGVENQLTVGVGSILERQYQAAAEKAASDFADRMNLQINF
ncbi:MAG: hypothetical protein DRP71_09515 [Verrucomicrobia bacterium]|nr:MAG: hypothetical protein DRP71_09515 [Verrucomicrobiota bacterium]